MQIKAKLAQLTAKQGKAVVQFEVDEACSWALPDFVAMAGSQVILGVEDPQQRLDIDGATEEGPTPFGGLLPEVARAVDVDEIDGAGEVA